MIKVKKEIIKLSTIFIIVILFTLGLFPSHYATDTYNIIELGFEEYAKKWFSPSGRTVGMLLLFMFEKLQLTCDQYIFVSKIFSVIIATVSIYLFNNMFVKYSKCENNKIKEIAFLVISLVIFLNHGTYQYFYYPEACVMWLGVLMVVLAIKINLNNEAKFRFIKSFICIFVAMNCYQAVIFFYIPARLLFMGLNNESFKRIIINTIKDCVAVGISMLLGYVLIEILTEYYKSSPYLAHDFILSFILIKHYIKLIIFYFVGSVPNYLILTMNILTISFALILPEKFYRVDKKKAIFVELLIIISAFAQVLAMISLTGFYMADRIQFSYVSLIGINMAFILGYTNLLNIKKINISFLSICLVLLILNVWNSIDITLASIETRELDVEIGYKIADMIEDYERHNQKVKKVVYCYDKDCSGANENVRTTGDPTLRILAGDWVLDNAIRCLTNRKDLYFEYRQSEYITIFEKKVWDEFSEEQIQFVDDTMYYCIY